MYILIGIFSIKILDFYHIETYISYLKKLFLITIKIFFTLYYIFIFLLVLYLIFLFVLLGLSYMGYLDLGVSCYPSFISDPDITHKAKNLVSMINATRSALIPYYRPYGPEAFETRHVFPDPLGNEERLVNGKIALINNLRLMQRDLIRLSHQYPGLVNNQRIIGFMEACNINPFHP